jgi:hypothetical protein
MNCKIGRGTKDGLNETWLIFIDDLQKAIEDNPDLIFYTEDENEEEKRAIKVKPFLKRKNSVNMELTAIDWKGKLKKKSEP